MTSIGAAITGAMTLPVYFDISKGRRRIGLSPRTRYEEGVMCTACGICPVLARAGESS